jgi:mRNA interferase MazF
LPNPGDIVVVDFPGVQGVKRRPAIVISSDEYHLVRPDVIVGLVTSQLPNKPGSMDYILADWRFAGLNKPSAFRAFLVTLPRAAITSSIGRPSAVDLAAILKCVHRAIAI